MAKKTTAHYRKLPEFRLALPNGVTRGAKVELGLLDIPPEKMDITDSVLADVSHLANLYPIGSFGLDILKANVRTGEFHAMYQYLDKHHLMTICPSG